MKRLTIQTLLAALLTACLMTAFAAGAESPLPDAGINEEIPIWQFCHGDPDLLETAVIVCCLSDCEAGPIPQEMDPEEEARIREIALHGVVTGQENDMSLTGGFWSYVFLTPEGDYILSLDLYEGLLIGPDGMYAWELRP